MSRYSVVEAKNRLSELIDRALQGDEVIITRHGVPVAEIRGVQQAARPITQADVDWLVANRVGSKIPDEDAGTFVSRMRDEEWEK